MTDNTSFLTIILYVMLAVMAALAMTFMVIYLNMKIKEKQSQKEDDALAQQKPVKKTSSKTFPRLLLTYLLPRSLIYSSSELVLICFTLKSSSKAAP